MFDYPAKAEFNRTLPKSKIYEFAKPTRAIRTRFVSKSAKSCGNTNSRRKP